MVDFAEWVAIVLGVTAIAIAVWDDLRDHILLRWGPAHVELVRFDFQDRHWVPPEGSPLMMTWLVRNRLSWPVKIGFGYELKTVDPERGQPLDLRDNLGERYDSSQILVPPRQPITYYFTIKARKDVECEMTPVLTVFAGKQFLTKGQPRQIAWVKGIPELR